MANRVALGRVISGGSQYGLFVSRSGVDVVDGSGNLGSNLHFSTLYTQGVGGGPTSLNGMLWQRIASGQMTLTNNPGGNAIWPGDGSALGYILPTYTNNVTFTAPPNSSGSSALPIFLVSQFINSTTRSIHYVDEFDPGNEFVPSSRNIVEGIRWRALINGSTIDLRVVGLQNTVVYYSAFAPGLD